MKPMTVLTNLLIFFLPFGVLLSFSPVSGVRVYVLDVLVGFLCILIVVNLLQQRINPFKNLIFSSGVFFILFGFVSLILNMHRLTTQEFFVSGLYGLRFLVYTSLLLVPQFLEDKFRQTIQLKLFISGIIFAIFGYLQYFLYSDLRNLYYAGWDEHLYRLFSTFLDPNYAGAFLVMTFILGIGLLFNSYSSSETKRLRNFKVSFSARSRIYKWIPFFKGMTNKNSSPKPGVGMRIIPLIVCEILLIPAIFLTYSRSTFLMFGISIIVFLLLMRKVKWILFGFGILLIGILFLPKNLGGEGVNLLRTASIGARFESYQRAVTIFSDSPIYGIGFNAYRYAHLDAGFSVKDPETNHAGAGVSNSFLFVLATTGIIGFVLYLNFWFQVIRGIFFERANASREVTTSKESSRQARTIFYLSSVAVASLSGLFLHSQFENSLFYIFIMVWVFLIMGFNQRNQN